MDVCLPFIHYLPQGNQTLFNIDDRNAMSSLWNSDWRLSMLYNSSRASQIFKGEIIKVVGISGMDNGMNTKLPI